jgi:hypothetical protein
MLYDYPLYTALRINATRKIAVKKVREAAVKNYNDAISAANQLRTIGNDQKVKISDSKHRALVTLAKSELGKKLIGATRIEKSKPY